ncbi:MAG: Peptidase family, partial [Bacteroidota bacterium]
DHKFLGSLIEGSNSYILPEEIIKMRINHELMILYAGYLSELKYGVANEEGAYSDLMVINSFIKVYSETEEQSKNIIEYCYNTTIKILDENWLYLRILANELLKKDTLSFQEIDKLLKNFNFNNLTELKEFENQLM